MAFRRKQGKTKFMYFGSTASQLISKGAVVALSSGRLIPAANDTSPSTIVGVIHHAITATDTEYGTAGTPVEVETPVEMNVIWEAEVDTTATFVNTDQGKFFDLTLGDDGLSVDPNVTVLDAVFCTGFITSTLGEFVLNIGPTYYDAT